MTQTTALDGRAVRRLIAAGVPALARPEPEPMIDDRRRKDLLRAVVDDLLGLEQRCRVFADGLQSYVDTSAGDDLYAATEETVSLRVLADEISGLVDATLRRERRWNPSQS